VNIPHLVGKVGLPDEKECLSHWKTHLALKMGRKLPMSKIGITKTIRRNLARMITSSLSDSKNPLTLRR
jgi:hypothetical protein